MFLFNIILLWQKVTRLCIRRRETWNPAKRFFRERWGPDFGLQTHLLGVTCTVPSCPKWLSRQLVCCQLFEEENEPSNRVKSFFLWTSRLLCWRTSFFTSFSQLKNGQTQLCECWGWNRRFYRRLYVNFINDLYLPFPHTSYEASISIPLPTCWQLQ